MSEGKHPVRKLAYSEAPILVYWELTRACDLACKHCRAEAIPYRDPNEFDTAEGKKLLQELQAFGEPLPHLIMTGGDPLKRPDLFELIGYAVRLGFKVSVSPSGTRNLTQSVIADLKSLGVRSLSLSIDGSTAEKHDAFRGVGGCFQWTLDAAQYAKEVGMQFQVNTLVTADNIDDQPYIFELVKSLGAVRWSLFLLIPVGRGRLLHEPTPALCESFFQWLYGLSKVAPFEIKTTEAPFYRRVAYQYMRRDGMAYADILRTSVGRGFGVRDGNGIMFISHTGDVYPSGFLPVVAGNVRNESPAEIYRASQVFKNIRDTSMYKGKCGKCEYKAICGGSRARAYAYTCDYLESDPLCPYEPKRGIIVP